MLNIKNKRSLNATWDVKCSKKFNKYLLRIATTVDGTNKKYASTPVNNKYGIMNIGKLIENGIRVIKL
jgi:hypothetical protein